ncbi:MAG: hypothetical protein ACP5F8_00580 [Candidatus Aenigmatarchaeota archaeon]
MDVTIKTVAIIFIAIVIVISLYLFLSSYQKSASSIYSSQEELNNACLELIKNGCDEKTVIVNSKKFEEICKDNGLNLVECKKHCGC